MANNIRVANNSEMTMTHTPCFDLRTIWYIYIIFSDSDWGGNSYLVDYRWWNSWYFTGHVMPETGCWDGVVDIWFTTVKCHYPNWLCLTVCYWKWWFNSWIFPLKVVIFHRYVSLPEGIFERTVDESYSWWLSAGECWVISNIQFNITI